MLKRLLILALILVGAPAVAGTLTLMGAGPMSGGGGATPLPPTITTIVGLGDSIIAGQAASSGPQQWFTIFNTAKSATGLNEGDPGTVVQNSNGSGGTPLTANLRDTYQTHACGANKRDWTMVADGYNDGRYTGAPATFNVANYIIDYRQILNGLLACGYTLDQIILVSPYWISDTGLVTGGAGFTGQTRVGFEAFVAATEQVATEYGTYYADVYAAMRDGGGAALISGDFIHPNDAGHAVIAATVLAATKKPTASFPAEFLNDTFTDTNGTIITSHTPTPTGMTWELQVGGSGTANTIQSNRLYSLSVAGIYHNIAANKTGADYYAEGVFTVVTALAGERFGIIGRASPEDDTFYFVQYSRSVNAWQLFKTVNGVSTQLGTNFADTFTTGSKTVRLIMTGTAISASIDGVPQANLSATDSAIPLTGLIGVRNSTVQTTASGTHLDSLVGSH